MKYDEVMQLAKDIHEDGLFRFVAAIEAAAVAAEREACAKVCDEVDRRWINQAEKCAERIRARARVN